MFISSGAVGVGVIMRKAYKARLAATLEKARLEYAAGDPDYAQEQVRELEEQIRTLRDRVEFNERLIGGRSSGEESEGE